MERWSQLFKALSEPVRLRLLHLLAQGGEVCVCDLVNVLGVSQSMVSRHLAYLRNSGWVVSRRDGLWMHYRLAGGEESLRAEVLAVLARHAQNEPTMATDLERLQNLDREAGSC
ncbi:MAG: metalloregulator ArsR/SmtB family transcription factor [Magnetococcales bacterium]|nr:metalloregulator ArsR/SmtB family transcription factor [Magnetococcales bacterium]